MKKYLIFMLLALVSVGVSAADVTTVELTFDSRALNEGSTEWYHRDVTDASQIRVGDIVLVSYDKVTSAGCQYAICDNEGYKIYTNGADEKWECYTCPIGDTDFTFPIDADLYKKIVTDGKGLQIQDKGLAGSMTIKIIRMSENWSQYKPANATEIMSTPQYIKDWYNDGYVLNIGSETNYVGKTLRVVCLETGDDSYAFLKKNTSGWPSLMSGSDKFSIAGWKYFEIKINDELNTLLKSDGLRIGGNNYYIAGIYVYGTDTTAPAWTDEDSDVIDTYTFSNALDGNAKEWDGAVIPGKFFEYKGQDDNISATRLANTKNNIIRLVFDGTAGAGAQVSAKDAAGEDANKHYASYIRQRVFNNNNALYNDYKDVTEGAKYYDFELSDAITIFKDYQTPVVDATDNVAGVKKGMLSTLLQNGMEIGANKVKITKVEIRKSRVSKYVSGYAEYNHPLSDKVWRPISLPYNLTRQQVEDAFGSNVMVCDLGASNVTKQKDGSRYLYHIVFNFERVKDPNGTGIVDKNADYLNANYPYIIKIKDNLDKNTYNYSADGKGYTGPFVFEHVKADVRDFQAYEFRTGTFTYGAENSSDPDRTFMTVEPTDKISKDHEIWEFEQEIKQTTKDAYLVFQSTAPVFNITNTSVGEVERINGVEQYTVVKQVEGGYKNYFFYDGALWPVEEEGRNIKSGLAYVRFPEATYDLFNKQNSVSEVASFAKMGSYFPIDESTTGIEEIVPQPKKQNAVGIYSLGGQLIRKGTTTDGLAKGIYIVNGKKVIVNQ